MELNDLIAFWFTPRPSEIDLVSSVLRDLPSGGVSRDFNKGSSSYDNAQILDVAQMQSHPCLQSADMII